MCQKEAPTLRKYSKPTMSKKKKKKEAYEGI